MVGLISGFYGVNLVAESFFSDLLETGWYNLVCVECLQMIKLWWLVFVLLGVDAL